MTTLPGPEQPRSLAGLPVAGLLCWLPPSGNTPIGVSLVSYAGQVQVGLTVDAALVPHPASILTAIREELHSMEEIAS